MIVHDHEQAEAVGRLADIVGGGPADRGEIDRLCWRLAVARRERSETPTADARNPIALLARELAALVRDLAYLNTRETER